MNARADIGEHYRIEAPLDVAEAPALPAGEIEWGSAEAGELLAQVRAFSGLAPVILELDRDFAEFVRRARSEAREYLDSLGEVDPDQVSDDHELADEIDDTFVEACRRADERQRRAPISVATERAASSTLSALMYSLRERGTRALDEPDTRRRFGELSDEQLIVVGAQLRGLKSRAWSAHEVSILLETRESWT
jgi:hypothetical protein